MFNLFLVVAACLVAFEQPQLRQSHRLPREITAIIHSENQSWTGITKNVSETGAQVLLDIWPNIPDEVRIELIGDYGARALVDARILRGAATSKLQTLLSIQFVNLSRTQLDDLIVVLYSDVQEWYSQKRSEKDKPFESFKFIVTSIARVFKEFQPEVGVKVRKQVRAIAQLYWEGWEDSFFQATVTEIGSRDLRLELENHPYLKLDEVRETAPIIGLLFAGDPESPVPQSILAQVQTVNVVSPSLALADEDVKSRVVMELSFPESLDRQQRGKIRRLLRSLDEQSLPI
jgi:cellulose synthase (UDP-forming)